MSWAGVVAARLRALFEHKRLERQLDDEVRFHLEMQAVGAAVPAAIVFPLTPGLAAILLLASLARQRGRGNRDGRSWSMLLRTPGD